MRHKQIYGVNMIHKNYEWVRVTERLPEDDEAVLMMDETMKEWLPQIGWYEKNENEGSGFFIADHCLRVRVIVTHWMPCPSLKHEEDTEEEKKIKTSDSPKLTHPWFSNTCDVCFFNWIDKEEKSMCPYCTAHSDFGTDIERVLHRQMDILEDTSMDKFPIILRNLYSVICKKIDKIPSKETA